MPPVGMRRCIARLDEAVEHVSNPTAIDDRDGSERGVADDGAVAHELDRARVGQRRDRARDAIRVEVDDREPRLRVTGDERRERAGQRRSQAERSSGGEESEVAAVHQLPTARQGREVPRGSVLS